MAGTLGRGRRLKMHVPTGLMQPFAALAEKLLPWPPPSTDQIRMLPINNATDFRRDFRSIRSQAACAVRSAGRVSVKGKT